MITFNPAITEVTTAATDAVTAVFALACIAVLNRQRAEHRRRVGIWSPVFGLLAFTSVQGALAHWLNFSSRTQSWLWRPLFLLLDLVVAAFMVGAVLDFEGEHAARTWLVPVLGLVFFMVTEVASGSIQIFVAYEAAAMLAALGIYMSLALKLQLEGAATIAVGIVLNMLAAAIQASGSIPLIILLPMARHDAAGDFFAFRQTQSQSATSSR